MLLLDSILEGFAWWLSACPQRPSVQSLQCHGLTPPGKTEQPLPKLAALLINTRKHNLRVLRAGPKSTVSWESGHVGGTRDAPPGAGHAAPFGDLLQPSRGTEDGLELRLPARSSTSPITNLTPP